MRENKKEFKRLLKILLDEHGLSVPQIVSLAGSRDLTENIIKNAISIPPRPYRADTPRINLLKLVISKLESKDVDADIDGMTIEEMRAELEKLRAQIERLEKQSAAALKGQANRQTKFNFAGSQ